MDISQLLGSDLGQQVISGITKNSQATEQETSSVISAATPVLLGMLKKNSQTEAGASSLLGALSKHDGSALNNISGLLNSGSTADGEGILGHILGGQKNQVQSAISKKTGVDASKVGNILAMLAPIIMAKLGSQANSNNVSTGGGIGDILGGLLGGADSSSVGGSILSSVLGGALGGGSSSQKEGGLGGVLGGLFGNK